MLEETVVETLKALLNLKSMSLYPVIDDIAISENSDDLMRK